MDLFSLRCFVEVARRGSFSKAAQQLYRTQPAVSVQVRKLEEELDHTLFDRSTRKPRLTDTGMALFASVKELLEKIDGLKGLVAEAAGAPSGTLTIASNASLISLFLPPILKEFHGNYPGVHLRLLNLTARGIARAIEEGEADIGLGFLVEGYPDITVRRLTRAHFVLACGRNSVLARKRRLLLNEILAGPLLHFEEGVELRVHIERTFKGKRSLEPVLELPTIESILHYVRNGFGHSILPEYAVSGYWRNELVLRRLSRWIAPLEICAYVHRKRLLSAAAAKLLEMLPHVPRRGRQS